MKEDLSPKNKNTDKDLLRCIMIKRGMQHNGKVCSDSTLNSNDLFQDRIKLWTTYMNYFIDITEVVTTTVAVVVVAEI